MLMGSAPPLLASVTRATCREKIGVVTIRGNEMEKDRNINEFSSIIAEVVGRLRSIVSDLENTEMNRELTLMRTRENADVALRFMESMHRAIGPDETD